MSQNKEFERSIRAREFQDDMALLLNEEDREYVHYCLKEFSKYKDVAVLVKSLMSVLKTPETRNLLPVIRELLPRREQKEYDKLAPYHKMAHPIQRLKHKKEAAKHLQTVVLEKEGRLPLGFSIRGGKEMGLGIYVSEIDPQSVADNAGLRVGDQIVEVNAINFEWLSHEAAVEVFKKYSELEITTFNSGRLPKFEDSGEAFRWIDPDGNVLDDNEVKQQENMDSQPFSSSSDKKKVVIKKQSGRSVGLRIRGGKEFKLGIFVVSVEKGSLAEDQGLVVGDQILMVNGINFKNILHDEAVSVLKTSEILMMSVQSVGRIPRLRTVYRKKSVPDSKTPSKPPTEAANDNKRHSLSNFKDGLGESPKFTRNGNKGKNGAVSPLAKDSHNAGGDSSDNVSLDEEGGASKFQYGLGKGVMLSSTAINPVREQIMSKANKLLSNEDEVSAMERKLAEYEEKPNVDKLVTFLMEMLDTPEKLGLVNDIRSALRPQDLSKFDKKMSAHEVKAKKKKKKKAASDEEEDNEPSPVVLRPKKETAAKGRGSKIVEEEEEEEEDKEPSPVVLRPKKGAASKGRGSTINEEEEDTEPSPVVLRPKKETAKKSNKKVEEEEEEEEELTPVSIKPMGEKELKKKVKDGNVLEEDDIEDEITPVSITPTKETKKGKKRDSTAQDDDIKPQQPRPQQQKPRPSQSESSSRLSKGEFEKKRQAIVVQASMLIKSMAELKSVDRRLKEYETNQDIDFLLRFLLTILDTPKKRALLKNIKELISPNHIEAFEKRVSEFLPPQSSAPSQPPAPTGNKQAPTGNKQAPTGNKQAPARKPSTSTETVVTVETHAEKGATPNAPTTTPSDSGGGDKPKDIEAIRQKVLAQASKVLKIKDELKGVEKRLKQYEGGGGDIDFLLTFILTIFDSPKKHIVLADIRELVKEKDLAKYDEATLKYLKKPEQPAGKSGTAAATQPDKKPPPSTSGGNSAAKKDDVPKAINIPPPPYSPPNPDEKKEESMPTLPDPGSIANEIKNKGGAGSLRKVEKTDKKNGNGSSEESNAFTDPAAQEVLEKANSNTKDKSTAPQSRDSFLAWNEDYSQSQGKSKIVISPGKPLTLEIEKTAFFLGIELREAEEGAGLVIDEIVEDGAAFNDGFLTPGFKVLKIDDSSLAGLTVGDAEAVLNERYESDKPSINLLVVSPPPA